MYVVLTAMTLGLELTVCMSCTFCCIFGKGLALRGPHGARSVHHAVENLKKQQTLIFTQFLIGILGYLLSHVMEIWIYFRPRIALTVSIPLIIFFLAIIYYTVSIIGKLHVAPDIGLTGQVAFWQPYERIQDLDEEMFKPLEQKSWLQK